MFSEIIVILQAKMNYCNEKCYSFGSLLFPASRFGV